MKNSIIVKICATMLACTVSMTMFVPVSAGAEAEGKYYVIGSDIEIDYLEYQEVINELGNVNRNIAQNDNNSVAALSCDNSSEYQSLLKQRESLYNQLDEMGVILDIETLSQFPAPATETFSGYVHSGDVEEVPLTGSLADIEEYYDAWFYFIGYEKVVTLGNEEYRTCVIKVIDEGSGVLINQASESEILSGSDADDFGEIADTVFSAIAEGVATAMDLTVPYSWVVSSLFSGLTSAINSGNISINDIDKFTYSYAALTESQLMYGYTWDEDSSDWVYCVAGGDVYVSETHIVIYPYYTGVQADGASYSLESDSANKYRLISPYTESEICDMAAAAYMGAGYSTPNYTSCYQTFSIDIERTLNGKDTVKTIYPIICRNPGDLWTLA